MESSHPVEDNGSGRALQEEASNCATIDVTGIYPGTYEETQLYGLRADYVSLPTSSDSSSTALYFELASDRRRRRLEDHLEASQEESGLASEDLKERGIIGAVHDVDILEACDTGTWVLAPTDGSYPRYEVWDCAGHPADISSAAWYVRQCIFCDLVPHNASAEIGCAEGSAVGVGGTGPTLAPMGVPTRNPIIDIYTPETLSPVALKEETSASCSSLEVTNAFEDGKYIEIDQQSHDRPIFMHDSGAYLLWAEIVRPSSSRAEDGVFGNFALDFGNRRLTAETVGWAPGTRLAQGRNLEMCDDGAWILTSPEDSDKMTLSLDCATHPVNVDTIWLEDSALGTAQARYPQVMIRCSDSDSDSSSWSETGAMLQEFPAATSGGAKGTTAHSHSVEGRDGEVESETTHGSGKSMIGVGIGAAAVMLTGAIFIWRYRSRRRQTQMEPSPGAEGAGDDHGRVSATTQGVA